MKPRYLLVMALALGGCATTPPQVVKVPVPVIEPCPKPTLPPKPDLSALAALKPTDSPQTVIETMLDALRKLAEDDAALRALWGEK